MRFKRVFRGSLDEQLGFDNVLVGGPGMKLVDTYQCYECGAKEYTPAKGVTSRTFKGVCDRCEKELKDEKAAVTGKVPADLSARNKS